MLFINYGSLVIVADLCLPQFSASLWVNGRVSAVEGRGNSTPHVSLCISSGHFATIFFAFLPFIVVKPFGMGRHASCASAKAICSGDRRTFNAALEINCDAHGVCD